MSPEVEHALQTRPMNPSPLPPVPEDWSDTEARRTFFARLPRSLAVLIACDLAALAPHGALGLKALETVRLWLVGQADAEELRAIGEHLFRIVTDGSAPPEATHRVALDALLTATAADAAFWAKDVSSLSRKEKRIRRRGAAAHYRRHRETAAAVMRCASDAGVRSMLSLAEQDPGARPLFWDAMLEAGYAPIDPARKTPRRRQAARRWRIWRRGE